MKNRKKGFTIVELVIVIAVIAILAAVLIPNLARLVDRANENSAMQAARNEYEAYLTEYAKDLEGSVYFVIIKGDYAFEVIDGQFNEKAKAKTEFTDDIAGKPDLSKGYLVTTDTVAQSSKTYYTYANGVYKVAETFVAGGVYEQTTDDLGSAEVAIYAIG